MVELGGSNVVSVRHGELGIVGIVLALLVAGCGGAPEPAAEPDAAPAGQSEDSGSSLLQIPGSEPSARTEGPSGSLPLRWQAPGGWVEEAPANTMRILQYRIPGPGGDGECVVYYFGPGQGGDPMANAQRWAGQFEQPDGSSSVDVMKVDQVESLAGTVTVVNVSGTYDGGMGGGGKQAGYMLLGGIAPGPDAPWFFKFVGPESTVQAEQEAFLEMMRSISIDG
jgi:hypothetical protein